MCVIVISSEILYLGNLGFKSLDPGNLGLDSSFIRGLLDLGVHDFLLRASADVAHLEHIHSTALRDYHENNSKGYKEIAPT